MSRLGSRGSRASAFAVVVRERASGVCRVTAASGVRCAVGSNATTHRLAPDASPWARHAAENAARIRAPLAASSCACGLGCHGQRVCPARVYGTRQWPAGRARGSAARHRHSVPSTQPRAAARRRLAAASCNRVSTGQPSAGRAPLVIAQSPAP